MRTWTSLIIFAFVASDALLLSGCAAQSINSALANGFDTLEISDLTADQIIRNNHIDLFAGEQELPRLLELDGPHFKVRKGDTIYGASDLYELKNIIFVRTTEYYRYENMLDFTRWPELRHIQLNHIGITQKELNNLLRVPKLRTLHVASSIGVDSIPSCVCELKQLDTLDLGWMRDVKIPDCLEKNGVVFVNRSDLSLFKPSKQLYSKIDHGSLRESTRPETFLEVTVEGSATVLKGLEIIANSDVIFEAKNLTSLVIKLKTTGQFPNDFDFSRLPELRHLYISGRDQVSEEFLRNLFRNAPLLASVSITESLSLDSIPACICELENLEYLSYSSGNREIALPECLTRMKQLKTIHITGPLDNSIWDMEYLENLKIFGYKAQNIPAEIRGLKSLQFLSLQAGMVEQVDPAIAELTKLKRLDLTDLPNLKRLPKFSTGFHNLEDLRIQDVPITNLPEFGEAKQLISIYVNKTAVKNLPELGNLKNLKLLLVEDSRVSAIPESVGEASSLQAIMLRGNSIADIPATIQKLTELKVLAVTGADQSKLIVALAGVEDIVLSFQKQKYTADPEFEEFCETNNILLKLSSGTGDEYWKLRYQLGLPQ